MQMMLSVIGASLQNPVVAISWTNKVDGYLIKNLKKKRGWADDWSITVIVM